MPSFTEGILGNGFLVTVYYSTLRLPEAFHSKPHNRRF